MSYILVVPMTTTELSTVTDHKPQLSASTTKTKMLRPMLRHSDLIYRFDIINKTDLYGPAHFDGSTVAQW